MMYEYYSEAVVLDCEPVAEGDVRVSLFTKRFGKITARAKSARKIISKLSPHLQIGNLVAARVVEKSGLRVADALKKKRLEHPASQLFRLNKLLHDGERDAPLWDFLMGADFSWVRALPILGWDPAHARCRECGGAAETFYIRAQEFYCLECASKLPQSEVVSIG